MAGLYQVADPSKKALEGYQGASLSAARMDKERKSEEEQKTAMGAIETGVAGASLGATIGTAVSTGASAGPWGAAAGAVVGLISYFLM
jgi:hypothetical protein